MDRFAGLTCREETKVTIPSPAMEPMDAGMRFKRFSSDVSSELLGAYTMRNGLDELSSRLRGRRPLPHRELPPRIEGLSRRHPIAGRAPGNTLPPL
jgi:hypothetical protein